MVRNVITMGEKELKVDIGAGFEMVIPLQYEMLMQNAEEEINRRLMNYPRAMKMWTILSKDPEVKANWDIANFIAVRKLKYNDHGEVHAKLVAANALRMLDILLSRGIMPDIMRESAGEDDDVHLVVLAAGLLHDIGNVVHRFNHPLHSVYLATSILNRVLPEIYDNPEIMYEIRNHILHCIYAHSSKIRDLTIEASLIGIADGTDMTKGRSRIPYDLGNVNIHTVSAMSVDEVEIVEGAEKPVEIRVYMTNSAGVFQVEEILHKKLMSGCISHLVDIVAKTIPEKVDTDERIVRKLVTEDGRFVHIREY